MSRHNRERRMLWKLGLTRRQKANRETLPGLHVPMLAGLPKRLLCLIPRATHDEIRAAKAALTTNRRAR